MITVRNSVVTLLAATSAAAFAGVAAAAVRSAEAKPAGQGPHADPPVVFASGLNNPRGLKFGPDGYLYVAEGGLGGANPPPDDPGCVVPPPVGPYSGSVIGSRISKIDSSGNVTTVVDNLPSSQTSAALGNLVSGVADVAFVGNTLYAVLAGAGCSHGVPEIPNGVIRVNPDGTWTMIADLDAFQRDNPVAEPEEDDFEPDGTWYSLISVHGDLYAVEPNHGEIDRITTDGRITRVVDVSATEGHVVPTAIAHHGNFYFGNLSTFPQPEGASNVWKVTPSGRIKLDTIGFNMVTGLVFDHRDRMYVLEASAPPAPGPNPTGRILRISPNGKTREVIAEGLLNPSGMTLGPDGDLYVTNVGFGPPPVALGTVVRIHLLD